MLKQGKFIQPIKFGNERINIFHNIIIAFVLVMLFSMPLLFRDQGEVINWDHIFRIWVENGLVLLVFLINRLVLLPNLLLKKREVLYAISIIFLIVLSVLVLRAIHLNFDLHAIETMHEHRTDVGSAMNIGRPRPGRMNPPLGDPVPFPSGYSMQYGNFLILNFLLLGFDLALFFSIRGIASEQARIETEKENVQMKMDFLKHQISPHFFMNTLNNIHALVDINTEETKATIIKLSRLMGYMLYDSQSNMVELQKEFDFVTSYIELMKLRYTDDVDIQSSMPTQQLYGNIPPLLTISFIENAFKYGVSYENESHVHISYKVLNNRLFFYCENSINVRPKVKSEQSGIGIVNTKNRLQLLYGNDHQLNITDNDERFIVNLNFPL